MNAQLDELGGEMLERQIESYGIFVRTGRTDRSRAGRPTPSTGCASTTARRWPPTCWCWPAACARASTSRAPPACPSTRASSSTTRWRPRSPGVYAIGECAEHGGPHLRHRRAGVGTGRRPGRRAHRREPAGALPRLEALHAPQGGRRRRRVDGPDRSGARQRRGDPGRRDAPRGLPQAGRARARRSSARCWSATPAPRPSLVQLFDRGDLAARGSAGGPLPAERRFGGERARRARWSATATRSARRSLREAIAGGAASRRGALRWRRAPGPAAARARPSWPSWSPATPRPPSGSWPPDYQSSVRNGAAGRSAWLRNVLTGSLPQP